MVQINSDAVILDNGAYNIRVGTSRDAEPRLVPNCIFKAKSDRKRVFIGSEIEECTDRSGIFYSYSCEKGYLVNWDVQQQVWDKTLAGYLPNAQQTKLILTDLNYLIPAIKDQSYEIIFEHYEFGQLLKTSAQSFSTFASADGAAIVIDAGFSCTTVAAFFENQPIKNAVIRIDLGGKGLTNQLKDWISYRYVNVMEETFVVNECKEDCCFVSLDPDRDMRIAQLRDERNTIKREYVLPDFMERQRGYIYEPGVSEKLTKLDGQVIPLNHERFMLPEALFWPSNIQLDQMGVAEAVAEVIRRSPTNLQCALARNIIITGGSSKFPNFEKRLKLELSSLLETRKCCANFLEVLDPITHAWVQAQEAYNRGLLNKRFIKRSDWQEHGDSISKRFHEYIDN